MSRFEYLSVLVSIVIALGISEIVSCWGRLLRNRARVDFDWLHGFWCAFMIVLMIQFWWGFWEFRVVESWSFPGLLAVVAEVLVLVLAAMALLPNTEETGSLDLRAHYFQQSRPFFLLGGVLIAQLVLVDRLVGEQPFIHPENAFRLPGLLVAGVAATYPNERLHVGLAVVATVLFLGFVAFTFSR
jgi:hypothetical protein